MLKKISGSHLIFSSHKFMKDAISFNLISSILTHPEKYPDTQIFSDENDIILLNTDPNHPVLIWTSDDFNEYETLYTFLIEIFSKNSPLSLTTKKECYQFFKNKNLINEKASQYSLGVYKCKNLKPVSLNGYLSIASNKDFDLITQMIQQFYNESQPEENNPLSYYQEIAQSFINQTQTHKVWRNTEGKITSVGRIDISKNNARIGRIYTLPEERGKSYAKMLVQELTKIAFQMNLTPVLYTNYEYEPSNRCYQKIGYELLNVIPSYAIHKKNT